MNAAFLAEGTVLVSCTGLARWSDIEHEKGANVMNAHEMVNLQTLENQTFALAARLHVILRREMGRITDVEYMRLDPAYCRHVLDLVGSAEPEEVRSLCSKLDDLYFGSHGLFVRHALVQPVAAEPVALQAAPPPPYAVVATQERYVGRLR
jgi:hypothetical protein